MVSSVAYLTLLARPSRPSIVENWMAKQFMFPCRSLRTWKQHEPATFCCSIIKPTRKRWRLQDFNGTFVGSLITLTGVFVHEIYAGFVISRLVTQTNGSNRICICGRRDWLLHKIIGVLEASAMYLAIAPLPWFDCTRARSLQVLEMRSNFPVEEDTS